jgi:hypothetical protein
MKRMAALLVLVLVGAAAPAPAGAACADRVAALQQRLKREHYTDREREAKARKELSPVFGPLPPGESECRNIVTRAWRILKAPKTDDDEKDDGRLG